MLSEEQIKEQILTEPRKNKYGLVMDPLEQELENIKLELREIEKFDPRNQKGETSYEFFMRVYGKYRDADDISPLAAGLLVKRQYIFHVRESSTI